MARQMIVLDSLVSNPSPTGAMAAHEFTITRRVEFSETDMAGIVHFSTSAATWSTPSAFFRSLDRSIVDRDSDRLTRLCGEL